MNILERGICHMCSKPKQNGDKFQICTLVWVNTDCLRLRPPTSDNVLEEKYGTSATNSAKLNHQNSEMEIIIFQVLKPKDKGMCCLFMQMILLLILTCPNLLMLKVNCKIMIHKRDYELYERIGYSLAWFICYQPLYPYRKSLNASRSDLLTQLIVLS